MGLTIVAPFHLTLKPLSNEPQQFTISSKDIDVSVSKDPLGKLERKRTDNFIREWVGVEGT